MPDACHRCGKTFVQGDSRYEIKVVMKSGFDGYLPDYSSQDFVNGFDELVQKLEISSERAERDVYYELEIVLCYRCRRELEKILAGFKKFEETEKKVH